MVNIKIDHNEISVPEGTTIMEAAALAGIDIPKLCYLKGINEIAACRVCLVEVAGKEKLVTACNNKVQEGLEILEPSPTKLTYTIKVTLPTSAGNEYQDKTVTVDLKWWLTSDSGGGSHPGGGEVIVVPKTGDDFPMELMIGAAALALVLLVVLLGRRRARHD